MGYLEEAAKKIKKTLYAGDSTSWGTEFLPCGIPDIDYALGGGIGKHRCITAGGLWSTGKTMILYYFLAMNQRLGGDSALLESEGGWSADFYRGIGGDPHSLFLMPDLETCEEAFDFIYNLCNQKIKDKMTSRHTLIGWDSIAATSTQHRQDTDLEVRDMSKSIVMDNGVKKIRSLLKPANVTIFATNQIREQIGSMSSEPHMPGGNAWPFISSQIIQLRFDGGDKSSKVFSGDNEDPIGRWVKGNVSKNKCASPWGQFASVIYTHANMPHPIYGWPTTIGIDARESLFHAYHKKRIRYMEKVENTYKVEYIIEGGTSGRYYINKKFAPTLSSFYQREWPQVLAENPWLWNFPYTRQVPNAAPSEPVNVQPESPSDGSIETPQQGSGGEIVSGDISGASQIPAAE